MATLEENIDKVVAVHAALKAALEAKGVTVPEGAKLSDMARLIEGIEADTAHAVQSVTFNGEPSGAAVISPVVKCDFTRCASVSNCFSGCTKLTSLTLPEGFGSAATDVSNCFRSCSGLTSLTLPEGFGSAATDVSNCFSSCSGLTSLTLPEGFGSAATDVSNCFSSCSGLTSLTLPEGFGSAATNVNYCFSSCSGLISLDLGAKSEFGAKATRYEDPFLRMTNLENLTGAIKINGDWGIIDSKKLTHDSLMNVINGLVTVSSAKSFYLARAYQEKLTADEIAVATEKGWTVVFY